MTLSNEQIAKCARIVTGQHAEVDGERVIYTPHGPGTGFKLWSPSLTGEDWQKAQALDCIVAASKLKHFALLTWPGGFTIEYTDVNDSERSTQKYPDILSSACAALLGDKA